MNPSLSRREMIRRSLRYGGLGTLGGLAAWLGARSLRGDCETAGPCGGCPLFEDCALPKARSAKQRRETREYSSGHG